MNEYTVVVPRGKDTGSIETGIYPFFMFAPIFIPLMPASKEIVKDFSSYVILLFSVVINEKRRW